MDDRPTAREINVFDSLDERSAAEHFLGKDRSEAESLFAENFLFYGEDLMWMGPRAFGYYVKAAVRALLGTTEAGDSDAANSFLAVAQFRLEDDAASITEALPGIRAALAELREKLVLAAEDAAIYGDLRSKCDALIRQIDNL